MKVVATENFCGLDVSMCVGEVRDISDDNIVKDLLSAGYVKEANPATKGEAKKEKRAKA